MNPDRITDAMIVGLSALMLLSMIGAALILCRVIRDELRAWRK